VWTTAVADAALLPVPPPTVVHMLASTARRAPSAEALVMGGVRLSYAEYVRCVAGFALELRARGAAGQRVALLAPNSVEAAVTSFAIQAAGAVFCPVNPAYTARELRDILGDCGCRLIVALGPVTETLRPLLPEIGTPELLVLDGDAAGFVARWRADTTLSLDALLPEPDALGMIQYTGGTTGRSKGVMLSHRAVAANVAQREAFLPTRADDRFLCMMPLFHSFALAMNLYQAAWCGGCLVILPRYRPDWVIEAIARERITALPAGATVFTGLLGFDGMAGADLSSLRIAYSGASALPAEVLRRWQATVGCPIFEGYGQTEAGPILTYNSPLFPAKPGKVGPPLPLTEVQIVDTESGTRALPAGEAGEIRARGPQIMMGYWNRPEETASALRDGWLHTDDIGAFNADGHLQILDRKKDMVITGGYNVYPREVDEVLLLHASVREAATFGVPDSYRGERLVSQVVAASDVTDEQLLAHCRANLAPYKVPSAIRLVDAIAKTTVGKVDKVRLRAAFRESAGTGAVARD
jgi:long-chain acyl-CoA synthetase